MPIALTYTALFVFVGSTIAYVGIRKGSALLASIAGIGSLIAFVVMFVIARLLLELLFGREDINDQPVLPTWLQYVACSILLLSSICWAVLLMRRGQKEEPRLNS